MSRPSIKFRFVLQWWFLKTRYDILHFCRSAQAYRQAQNLPILVGLELQGLLEELALFYVFSKIHQNQWFLDLSLRQFGWYIRKDAEAKILWRRQLLNDDSFRVWQ